MYQQFASAQKAMQSYQEAETHTDNNDHQSHNNLDRPDSHLCNEMDINTCFTLAKEYMTGSDTTKQNYEKAASLFHDACDHSHTLSCAYYATLLLGGIGVPKDIEKGFPLLQKTCEHMTDNQEHTDACMNLGFFYIKGKFVSQDIDKGKSIILECCKNGNHTACYNLGNIYQKYFKNNTKAAIFYTKACNESFGEGYYNLGVMFQKTGNLKKAKQMYKKACDLKLQEGCDILYSF